MTTTLRLRVSPGSRRPGVDGRYGEGWKIRVAAAPEDGKANAAVVRLLAETLRLPARDIAIVSGQASRDKTVALNGIDPHETEQRLESATRIRKDPA
jgi:uncharacterized protein (TIGR00251 family)